MISLCCLAFRECAVMSSKKMHYWCVLIRDAFFSVRIMIYFLLTMPWNIATEGCFQHKGIVFDSIPCLSIHHSSSWALSPRRHLCQDSSTRFLIQWGINGKPKDFSFPNHTFCSLPWIFFKCQVICGSFMLPPRFIYFISYKNKPLAVLPLRR